MNSKAIINHDYQYCVTNEMKRIENIISFYQIYYNFTTIMRNC